MVNYWGKITAIILVLFCISPAWDSIAAEGLPQILRQIEKEQDQSIKDGAETEKIVATESASMAEELARLKAEEQTYSNQLNAVQTELDNLHKMEEALKKELEAEQNEINSIDGIIRRTANNAISLARDNIITAEYPDRADSLNQIATGTKFAGLEGIKTLVNFFFKEMGEQARIVRRTGKIIGSDGQTTVSDIIRIGRFTAYYRMSNGDVGFLTPNQDGQILEAVTGKVPSHTKRAIKAYFDNESDIAPIDPSAGGGVKNVAEQENLWKWISRGGPVRYFIFAIACLATIIILGMFIMLAARSMASKKVMDRIKKLGKAEKWK